MKEITGLGVVLALTAGFVIACSSTVSAPTPAPTPGPVTPGQDLENYDGLHEFDVVLKSGGKVTCLLWGGYKRGGLSCDWGHVK